MMDADLPLGSSLVACNEARSGYNNGFIERFSVRRIPLALDTRT